MSETIRLFVGADGTNCDLESQMVLEYSVRKHASQPVEIVWMQQAASGPYAGWNCSSGRTPFSHFRWSIPAMCGYAGKGIYTDSDFIFTADIAELWNQDNTNGILLKSPDGKLKTCCMAFDNAKLRGVVPDLPALRKMANPNDEMVIFFRNNRHYLSAFAGDWNCIDGASYASLDDPRIKAIHYSRMEHQPQLAYAIPRLQKEGRTHWYQGPVGPHPRTDLIALFDSLYREALSAGYSVDQYRVGAFSGATRRDFAYSQSRVSA